MHPELQHRLQGIRNVELARLAAAREADQANDQLRFEACIAILGPHEKDLPLRLEMVKARKVVIDLERELNIYLEELGLWLVEHPEALT
jgi:hypothetical protein